jgi:hypothetical protein
MSSPSLSQPFAIAIALGPGEQELARTADLLQSLRAYAPGPAWFVMVDDAPQPRQLDRVLSFPPDYQPVAIHHARAAQPTTYLRSKGICSAVLTAFSWIAANAPQSAFALKLDTDALVIAPFYEQILSGLRAAPDAGVIGAYDKSPNGEPRGTEFHSATVRSLHRPPIRLKSPRTIMRALRRRFGGNPHARASRHIGQAVANGYRYGEHCLGGAYAVSGEMLRRMKASGYLDDPAMWLNIDCPEDVMIGIYTRAVGMGFLGFVDNGQTFGVKYRGLPDTPQRLLERGYSVIHSVKNDPNATEDQIRAFYRGRREEDEGELATDEHR